MRRKSVEGQRSKGGYLNARIQIRLSDNEPPLYHIATLDFR